MIDRLVDEIHKCLKNECYMAALTSAIVLPDACAKAEYKHKGKTRYVQWCEKYLHLKEPSHLGMPADMLYKLRCNILHEGNPTVGKEAQVEKFALLIPKGGAHVTKEYSCSKTTDDGSTNYKVFNVDLIFLCEEICTAALNYYNANKEKFNFFDYRINNMSDMYAEKLKVDEQDIKVL